jgi:hypothetical protein
MRKVLIALFAVAMIGGGSALAQDMMGTHYWAGVSAGYPGAEFHFGVSDVAPSFSVRANLGFGYFGYGFTAGVDALYALPVDTGDLPINVYAGGGPTAAFGYTGGLAFGLNVFAGAEYRLGQVGFEPGGVFFEAGPGIYFTPNFFAGFVGRLGFNYHF